MKTAEAIQIAEEATFIPMQAAKGKETAVADLLSGAADIVRKTEPRTLQWFALRQDDTHFAIADFFEDQKGREAHFAGQVAATLKQAAGGALEGGWEKGVVAKVENSKVLASTKASARSSRAALAMRVTLKAKPGKEMALADLLTGAAVSVHSNEPGTLLWYAIRTGNSEFAIFDVFATEDDRAAHLQGQVAALLQANAKDMVQDGWDKGVVANLKVYRVLSGTY